MRGGREGEIFLRVTVGDDVLGVPLFDIDLTSFYSNSGDGEI